MKINDKEKMIMRFFDAFAGIGGFHLGIKQVRPDWECLGYCEIDKYASKIYEKSFKGCKNYGDIRKMGKLPEGTELLMGGFPCQAFSIAGKRKGFEDTRGTLFFELARLLRESRPKYFIFENVKGLLSHDKGRTFQTILATLGQLGYDVQWQVMDSQDWGLAQHRERVFIIGHIRGEPRPKVFPLRKNDKKASKLKQIGTIGKDSEATRVYTTDGLARTIKNGGGMGAKTGLYEVKAVLTPDRPNIRRLTPLECERLQGFPDNWTAGISDSQRYKCLGNAVSVNVVRAIMERFEAEEARHIIYKGGFI